MAIHGQNKQPLRTDVYGGKSRNRPLSVLRIHASLSFFLSLWFDVKACLLTNDKQNYHSRYTVRYSVRVLIPDYIIGVAQKETLM